MYSKEEEKNIRLEFWKGFDTYCGKFPDLRDKSPKWLLYKTGIKHLELKFDVNPDGVIVALELNHKNEGRRLDMFEALEPYRLLLEDNLDNVQWEFALQISGEKEVGRVFVELKGVNYKRISDRQVIYDFMIATMQTLESNFLDIRDALKSDLQAKFNG